MFEILRKSLAAGIVTTTFPHEPLSPEAAFGRGRPEIDFKTWKDARPAAKSCPTGAIACTDSPNLRTVSFDLGKCTFCGLCSEADPSIRMTNDSHLAAVRREDLITTASYNLTLDGTQREPASSLMHPTCTSARTRTSTENDSPSPLLRVEDRGEGSLSGPAPQCATEAPDTVSLAGNPPSDPKSIEALGRELKVQIQKALGRSLHIRDVDAGSCNGGEVEIVGLNSPVYDIELLGFPFVASPRHADMLLVTGPVSRNMELALRKTYEATPAPRLVVAV